MKIFGDIDQGAIKQIVDAAKGHVDFDCDCAREVGFLRILPDGSVEVGTFVTDRTLPGGFERNFTVRRCGTQWTVDSRYIEFS